MDKIKKYAKMMIDEINSAAEYADMACKFKTLDIELSDEYKSMAEDELHHKSIICKNARKIH